MSTGALVFMITSWAFVISLAGWSFRKILSKKA